MNVFLLLNTKEEYFEEYDDHMCWVQQKNEIHTGLEQRKGE